MLVSFNGKTKIRNTKKCLLKRNGNFIDIHFEQNGKKKWIGVTEKELEKLLKTDGHGQKIEALVELDEKL